MSFINEIKIVLVDKLLQYERNKTHWDILFETSNIRYRVTSSAVFGSDFCIFMEGNNSVFSNKCFHEFQFKSFYSREKHISIQTSFFIWLKSRIKHKFRQNNKCKRFAEVNGKPGHPGKVFKYKAIGNTHLYWIWKWIYIILHFST